MTLKHLDCGKEFPLCTCSGSVQYKSSWDTKDSGVRETYSTGMVRDTESGKPRFDLLLSEHVEYEDQFLTRMAGLLARGAAKYGARNHEKARTWEEYRRMQASAFRHLMQWMNGEDDEDHAAAVAVNLFMAESLMARTNGDLEDE